MTALSAGRIDALRAETPGCAHRIHFNNAGAGLMPQPVVDAIKAHLDREAEMGGYEAADAAADAIDASYQAVAQLVNATPRNIGMVENATVAYAQALSSIPFERGDVLFTTSNDYVSNQLMFLSLASRFGIEIVRVDDTESGEVDVDALRRGVESRRPRLVAVTHVPTNSGLVQPVVAIGQVCREFETLYLVDACQSVGQLTVDVQTIGCDFLAATSRKFLRGPRGAGFLFVADRMLDAGAAPLFLDMQGASWTEANAYELVSNARRFENWEFAWALVLGTGAAATYASSVGQETIMQRAIALGRRLRGKLAERGLRVLDRGSHQCAIVTVAISGWEAEAFHSALERQGINSAVSKREYAVLDYAAKGVEWSIRLSPHYYNTDEEVDAVARAVADLTARVP